MSETTARMSESAVTPRPRHRSDTETRYTARIRGTPTRITIKSHRSAALRSGLEVFHVFSVVRIQKPKIRQAASPKIKRYVLSCFYQNHLEQWDNMGSRRTGRSATFFATLVLLVSGGQSLAGPPIDLTNISSPFATKAIGDAVWGLTNCTVSHAFFTITCPPPAVYSPPSPPPGVAYGPPHVIADGAGVNRGVFYGNITGSTYSSGSLVLTVSPTPTYDVGNTSTTRPLRNPANCDSMVPT